MLSRDEFDAIEFSAASSGDHRSAAERMIRLAETGTQTEAMPRAEAFIRAGEQYLLADDPRAAVTGFRQAIADGGPVSVDPRVPLARAFFALGRQAEAYDLIGAVKAEGQAGPRACDLIAELLVEYSDLPAALEWATAGVELCLRKPGSPAQSADDTEAGPGPGADENELRLLLTLRYRIRNDLGLPEDSYDEMLDET
jgi:hypothetical protein